MSSACRAMRPLLAVALIGWGGAVAAQVPVISPQYGAPPQPSALTVRLLAEAQPTAAFLERSSRLALDHAGAKRLRRFAEREIVEQVRAETALATAAAPTPVGRDPLEVAAVGAASVDEATETILSRLPPLLRTPGARAVAADRAIAQAARDDLGHLASLDGRAFDPVYVQVQAEGLRRLVALYRDYVQNGDDEHLRAFTVHELPLVRARLLALRGG